MRVFQESYIVYSNLFAICIGIASKFIHQCLRDINVFDSYRQIGSRSFVMTGVYICKIAIATSTVAEYLQSSSTDNRKA